MNKQKSIKLKDIDFNDILVALWVEHRISYVRHALQQFLVYKFYLAILFEIRLALITESLVVYTEAIDIDFSKEQTKANFYTMTILE